MTMPDHQELPPLPSPTYFIGEESLRKGVHPLARGKHKVPKNAPLLLWRDLEKQ